MNLGELHPPDKAVSARALSAKVRTEVTALHLSENKVLKKHVSKTPAILICVMGKVVYEDENKNKVILTNGDFFEIEPMLEHWLQALEDSQLILIK